MNFWIKCWLIVTLSIFLLLNVFTFLAIQEGAPYRFTSSLSYDAKISFIRKKFLSGEFTNVDTIVIGSSMGLNNINSQAIEEQSNHIHRVLNMSSWGLNTDDALELLMNIDLSKIKQVIYIAQYDDFTTNGDKVRFGQDMNSIKAFWSDDNIIGPYFQLLKVLPSKLKRYLLWKKYYADETQYRNLAFNENGDVGLNIKGKNINTSRYNEFPFPAYLPDNKYTPLIDMSNYLKQKNIPLIIARTPYRLPLLTANESLNDVFLSFSAKVAALAENEGFTYIDVHNELKLTDAYFADKSHLNNDGAILISKFIASKL